MPIPYSHKTNARAETIKTERNNPGLTGIQILDKWGD